jgi:hypothetical protein
MQNENHGRVSMPVGRTKPDRVHIGFIMAVFAALAALVFLAGCVTDTQEPGDSPSPPILVVEYTRTGGIAAFNDRLVVFENGQAVYSRGNKTGVFTVPSAQISELQTLLLNANFSSLAPSYPAPAQGADYFSYTITYQGKTITTETGGVPDALLAVIGRLDALLAESAPIS